MIAKMTKVTFLVYHKEYDCFLKSIRDLGVVHVVTKAQGGAENASLQESIRLSARYASAIKLLQGMGVPSTESHEGDADRGEQALQQTEELLHQSQQLAHRLQAVEKEVTMLEPWGDFDPQNISRLQKAGYQIGFYVCAEKQFKPEWADLYHATVINQIGSKLYFVTITKGDTVPELEVETAKLPENSLSVLQQTVTDLKAQQETLQNKLKELAETVIPDLQAAQHRVHSQIEFSKVVLSTDTLADNKLMLLEGWIPTERVPEMTEFLRSQEVYYETAAPQPGDDVPILLENKGFFRLFEPIMRLYMLPKYNELDLTPFFAPFFMLFFGLCLGDSGYGLFMLLAVTLYRLFAKKLSASMKSILTLVQILGASTMVCGLLTGTCFGFNLYDIQLPFFQTLKESISLDNQQMFNLSLILGGVQIIFGMILKSVNQTIQFGVKYAISTIGWILILVSTAVAFAAPGVMPMGGTLHLIFLGIGVLMAYLYNSPDKNVFVNIGLGLWDTYNMATGLLGDVLSYVRLFALGLSGGILASVFNSLAVGMSPDNVIAGPIVMVLIFVIGHAINIFMNVLGAMVHPMRLTFVEFFKNAGYEGGGKEYKPFKN
ncbi:V-type ATP synthase subunit I [Bacteroides mediterraneensis]|uniref:V-type ATP synthase subunit I n=1 Tax=Bacteroides mediterraneensis TaxID=1841856 RepID=A0ABS2ETW3_9BACE|nr:V-type ATPase 116kDa subunit family protein [Bacteroides mediterraneensis]MBM6758127.1 V-type ATP synthase subunit I [Bacteroides mediterraneensis]